MSLEKPNGATCFTVSEGRREAIHLPAPSCLRYLAGPSSPHEVSIAPWCLAMLHGFFFFFFASPLESQSLLGLVGSNLGSVATSVLTPEGPWRLGWSLILVPSRGSSRIQWWRLQTGFATIGLGEAKVRKRAIDWAPSSSPEVGTLNPLKRY